MTTPAHTPDPATATAIVLLAHGSKDSHWRGPIDAVAAAASALAPELAVRCAFLEWTLPTLAQATQALVQAGHTHIRIVPLFLGLGRHAREDLPELAHAMQTAHPQVRFEVQAPAGEQSELIDCLARLALRPDARHAQGASTPMPPDQPLLSAPHF